MGRRCEIIQYRHFWYVGLFIPEEVFHSVPSGTFPHCVASAALREPAKASPFTPGNKSARSCDSRSMFLQEHSNRATERAAHQGILSDRAVTQATAHKEPLSHSPCDSTKCSRRNMNSKVIERTVAQPAYVPSGTLLLVALVFLQEHSTGFAHKIVVVHS